MIDYSPFWKTLEISEGKLVYADEEASFVRQYAAPLKA